MLLGDLVSLYLAVLRGRRPDAGVERWTSSRATLAGGGSPASRATPPNLDTTVLRLARGMDALTINEAAETTGWSPRMLRYIESAGLVAPVRSASGYRLYGPAELQRLRTLRELLDRFEIGLSDVGFAARHARRPRAARSGRGVVRGASERPEDVAAGDWLRWEQEKHQALLAAAAPAAPTTATRAMETAAR